MGKSVIAAVFILFSIAMQAQPTRFFKMKPDSSGFALTEAGAAFLARLPMKCIGQEYPNKTGHVSKSDRDQALSPRKLHPAFYGCFDWHSSVHGHWMLVRLLKLFPHQSIDDSIRTVLATSLTPANIAAETDYFDGELSRGFERTYGWAWVLKLDQELLSWNDPDALGWHAAMQPLTTKIISLWTAFLPKQTYANRTGVHPNTAFGMAFALDYARAAKNTAFEAALVQSARRIYGADKNAPSSWEPDGSDFLSPSLEEADLMRRVLPLREFLPWFNAFISKAGLQHLTRLPVVSDRSDLQIVHLDGLCFSRSWCMKGLAALLPASDARKAILLQAARAHLAASLPNVVSGNYGGEHWLASFAVLAMSDDK